MVCKCAPRSLLHFAGEISWLSYTMYFEKSLCTPLPLAMQWWHALHLGYFSLSCQRCDHNCDAYKRSRRATISSNIATPIPLLALKWAAELNVRCNAETENCYSCRHIVTDRPWQSSNSWTDAGSWAPVAEYHAAPLKASGHFTTCTWLHVYSKVVKPKIRAILLLS